MAPTPRSPAAEGASDQDRRAVVADLSRRAEALARRPAPSAEDQERAREREKAVVRECRYLMRLLADRRRSEGEMRARLVDREVPASVAHEVMERIRRADLIDDAAFAAEWVAQRRRLRGLSDDALRRELARRRVEDPVIDAALAADPDGEQGEEVRARELVRARLARTGDLERAAADPSERARLSRRLDGYLRRRGYDGALARRVVAGEILHATGR